MSEALKAEKHSIILEAARTRFRRYGVRKTTMHEIAAEAGIAVGTLYLYFKNKDDLIVGCADQYRSRHVEEADQIKGSALPADEKIRQYLLKRFRANLATRTSSDHDAEIARAVLRVKPDRLQEESGWFLANMAAFMSEGIESGLFETGDLQRDLEVFLYSIAFFFPIPGKEPPMELTEQALLKVIDWFIEKWRR